MYLKIHVHSHNTQEPSSNETVEDSEYIFSKHFFKQVNTTVSLKGHTCGQHIR